MMLSTRKSWLLDRVKECISTLDDLEVNSWDAWGEYMINICKITEELSYLCGEWNKFYKDN